MNCIEHILIILARLDETYGNPDLMFQVEKDCLDIMVSMDEACSDAFVQVSQELIQKAGKVEDAGYKLQLVLYTMVRRMQPDALDIIITALKNDDLGDKGSLIDILDDFNDSRLIGVLMDVIRKDTENIDDDDPDELGGEIRYKAIDALLKINAYEAVDFVKEYMNDPAYMVREAVIRFLVSLNQQHLAPLLLQRIQHETYPSILKSITAAMVRWKYRDALPMLYWLLNQAKTEKNPSLKETITSAISELEVVP